MTVYVDDARLPYGRMTMSHMVADTVAELHDMADAVGLKRSWFQDHPRHPHYDLCLANRAKAVRKGAAEISRREMGTFLRRQRIEQRSTHKKRERGAAH
jgi:hypothetical protein